MKRIIYSLLSLSIIILCSCRDKELPIPEPASQVDHLVGTYNGKTYSWLRMDPSPPLIDSFERSITVYEVSYNQFRIENIEGHNFTYESDNNYTYSYGGYSYTFVFHPEKDSMYSSTSLPDYKGDFMFRGKKQ